MQMTTFHEKTHLASSKQQWQGGAVGLALTHKVPNEHRLLEKPGRLEAVMEELLQCSHQAVLPAQQHRQAASLWRHRQLRLRHQEANRKSQSDDIWLGSFRVFVQRLLHRPSVDQFARWE